MKKKLPNLKSDKDASAFLDKVDLTDYNLSSLKPVQFEFQPKLRNITMRLSIPLFEAIKEEAEKTGLPYQRFIRQKLEEVVHFNKGH